MGSFSMTEALETATAEEEMLDDQPLWPAEPECPVTLAGEMGRRWRLLAGVAGLALAAVAMTAASLFYWPAPLPERFQARAPDADTQMRLVWERVARPVVITADANRSPAPVKSARTFAPPAAWPNRKSAGAVVLAGPGDLLSAPSAIPRLSFAPAVSIPPAARTYSGPASGRVAWNGRLGRNELVLLGEQRASTGALTGGLPGVPVRIRVQAGGSKSAGAVTVLELPGPQNNWREMVLRNESRELNSILIAWEVIR